MRVRPRTRARALSCTHSLCGFIHNWVKIALWFSHESTNVHDAISIDGRQLDLISGLEPPTLASVSGLKHPTFTTAVDA